MSFLTLLPFVLLVPGIAADCTGFTTTQYWVKEPQNYTIFQMSDYLSCNNTSGRLEGKCPQNACRLTASGGLNVYAQFNVTSNPPEDVGLLERFFDVAVAAADANYNDERDILIESPKWNTCGFVEFPVTTPTDPNFCVKNGESGWIRFIPAYYCVTGTTDGCSSGPYENGTPVKVCGVQKFQEGDFELVSQRTIKNGAETFSAEDTNPWTKTGGMCSDTDKPSLGNKGSSLDLWTLGAVFVASNIFTLI